MLKKLHIRNYALIDEMEISFRKGLTILTGETGAGKSIVMGALSLILGERADSKSLLDKEKKCVVEGIFNTTSNQAVHQFLEDQDIEKDDELIIRREISGNGKSRVFINDTPSTLQILEPLATLLIDMHRQFDSQELQHSAAQLQLIDEVGKTRTLLNDYQTVFKKWKKLQEALFQLSEKNKQNKQELDYHQFLYTELESFNPQPDEIETIESELDILNNSESVKTNLKAALQLLQDGNEPILSHLKTITHLLNPHAAYIPALREIIERIESARIELKEAGIDIEGIDEKVQFDPEKISRLTERLNEGNRLLKKHSKQDSASLIALKNELAERIASAISSDEEEEKLRKEIEVVYDELLRLATSISNKRKKSFPGIETHINTLLKKVGMPNASIQVSWQYQEPSLSGSDKIDLLFDANKTGQYGSIARVASGGELSRLMLCIKSLLATSALLPTLIFDEIDSGISGEPALQVGHIMKDLSQKHQLICITHLPQIASKADQHYLIYKSENESGRMNTHLKEVEGEERINILAEMLSGKKQLSEAREMAKQLMK